MNEICAVFPGEGAQYIGMGKSLYDNYSEAKEIFSDADEILGYNLSDVIFNGETKMLSEQVALQPAIVTASCAYYYVISKRTDVKATHFAGYSVGSISASVCAGAIKFADAVRMAEKRGKLLDEAFEGKEVFTVQVEWNKNSDISNWIESQDAAWELSIVAYISPSCCIVCASLKNKRTILRELKKQQIIITSVKNSVPVGCEKAEKVSELFGEFCAGIQAKKKHKKIISCVDGTLYKGQKEIVENLAKDICRPANLQKMIDNAVEEGISKFVNIGPSGICSEWIKKLRKQDVRIATVDLAENAYYCVDLIEEKKLLNKSFLMAKMLTAAIAVQNNCFDDEAYETGVIQPYSEMRGRYEKMLADNTKLKMKDIEQQKEDLVRIMKTKGLNETAIKEHLQEIENETLITIT